jgi:hypothetical protein
VTDSFLQELHPLNLEELKKKISLFWIFVVAIFAALELKLGLLICG